MQFLVQVQWRSKGSGQVGARTLGCINTLFAVISKRVLNRNFDQSIC